MFRSLQFRLPAFFLAGIVLAGIVAALISVRLFQNYARTQSLSDLKREAIGLTQLYQQEANKKVPDNPKDPSARFFRPDRLEKATGDKIYYVGLDIFPGQKIPGLRRLPRRTVNLQEVEKKKLIIFNFRPPHEHRTFLAVAHRVSFRGHVFGALVVATPQAKLRSAWVRLLERLALALLAGIIVAGALAAYLARRITRPVLGLSRAADDVADGRYDVAIPEVPGGGEIGHLADRFREMAARLHEADELERNFLMTVSHELRTPLTAIRGHLEALREGVVEDEDAREESFAVIAAESDRLDRLVGDVLDLAKLDARRFTLLREEVDMERLVDRAYSAFGEEARRRAIDYRRDISAKPVIETDGDRVLQVISNLLANAFRWTPDGGRVALELSAVDGTVCVAVNDTGPGITEQERERIFRPFWSRDGGGTGLGLAIARELANALGGRIELETEPGHGSRFQLVLPAKPQS